MKDEIEEERLFNESSRGIMRNVEVRRSLPIFIQDDWENRHVWCSMKLTICLERLETTLDTIWNRVILLIKPIGIIKSASYGKIDSIPTSIISNIDLFEQVDLLDFKVTLQAETNCRCNIQMESFSFGV